MSKKGLDFKFSIMNKRFFLIAVLMLASISGFAQAQFSLYAGGAFPMGKLKAGEVKLSPEKWALINEKGDQGYAGIGFNIGMDILFPISSVDGLGITLGADFFYNGYNSELKDWVSDMEDEADEEFDSYSFKKPRIMNVPIMLGARYLYEVNDGFGLFAEAGLGVNLRFISKLSYEYEFEHEYYNPNYGYESYDIEESTTAKYKTAITFAYKFGVGIMLAEHFSIGIDYYGLGSSKVNADITSEYTENGISETDKDKFKSKALSCSELAVRIGYHF
jgi:opacity protein-like surface antigen